MPKQPQDHRPAKSKTFTFVGLDGEKHTLPNASVGLAKLTGGDFEDAALGGEIAQVGYLFKLLRASGPTAEAHAALRALPQTEVMEILEAWGEHGDGDGASLGE